MALKLIQRKDSPSWWLRGTVRGTGVYKSARTDDREAAEAIRIVTERQLLEESIFGKRLSATFEDAATAYLCSGGSQRFLDPLRALLGKREIRTINQSDLDAAAKKLQPVSAAATRNRQVYTPFIAVWNYAALNDWVDVRKWKRPTARNGTTFVARVRRAGTFPVEYDHAARYVAVMSPGPAMLMTALFYTGMRPIEMFALECNEVNVDGRWITLTKTKTGEPRGVPMHEFLAPLLSALTRRVDGNARVFRTWKGKPYRLTGDYGGQLKSAINGARRRSGIRDIAPYTARHSCSTALVVAGVHPHIKDQILGHAADSMSRHYTNVPQAPLIEAINKIPVPEAWRLLPWWDDPLKASRLNGNGRYS